MAEALPGTPCDECGGTDKVTCYFDDGDSENGPTPNPDPPYFVCESCEDRFREESNA